MVERRRYAGPLTHEAASCSYLGGFSVGEEGSSLCCGKLDHELAVTADEGEEHAVEEEAIAAEPMAAADAGQAEVVERQYVEHLLGGRHVGGGAEWRQSTPKGSIPQGIHSARLVPAEATATGAFSATAGDRWAVAAQAVAVALRAASNGRRSKMIFM